MRSRVSDVFVCGLGPVVDDVAGVDQGQVAVWYVRVASVAGLEVVGDGKGFDCGGMGLFDEHRGSSGRGNRMARPLANVVEGNERSTHAGATQEGA